MNRSATRPHRLIFNQDGATACTELLETLLVQFRNFLGGKTSESQNTIKHNAKKLNSRRLPSSFAGRSVPGRGIRTRTPRSLPQIGPGSQKVSFPRSPFLSNFDTFLLLAPLVAARRRGGVRGLSEPRIAVGSVAARSAAGVDARLGQSPHARQATLLWWRD